MYILKAKIKGRAMLDFIVEFLLYFLFYLPVHVVYLMRGERFSMNDTSITDYLIAYLFWGAVIILMLSYRDVIFA